MGHKHRQQLSGARIYGCSRCSTHLTTIENLMSKKFTGQHGTAYLFHTVLNVALGDPETRSMTTGVHVVRDLRCCRCHTVLGWKYDKAYEATQRYKEGKFILEKALLREVGSVHQPHPQEPSSSSPSSACSAESDESE